MGLDLTGHDKEAAVGELGGEAFFGHGVFEVELPLCAKTEAGNRGVFDDRGFVVAVPGHAFRAIVVEVKEAGVEGFTGLRLHRGFESFQQRRPGEWCLGGAGVGVVESGVAIPCDFAGGGNGFAEHPEDIRFPGDLGAESGEKGVCLFRGKGGAVIDGDAIPGEEVLRGKE